MTYYKIYLNSGNEWSIVCLQEFDERDYDEFRFLTDKQFQSEREARSYLMEKLFLFSVGKMNYLK